MKVSARGLLFVGLLLGVTYFACLLIVTPLLLLLPISLSLYRRWTDYLLALWLHLPCALLELLYGVKVKVCGDLEKVQGPCIFILNHRTRLDWLFFWSYVIRQGNPLKHRIVMKDDMRKAPVIGWGMQASHFIFISRKWAQDEKILRDSLAYFTSRGYPLQLLFFPEGTDLSHSNREKSHKYSEENGLPKYDYVLQPRTKGFIHCLQELRKGPTPPYVVDVSIGYVGTIPQNEMSIVTGDLPREIHFHTSTIPPSDIPSDPGQLADWLAQRWSDKEDQLRRFYEEKKFSAPYRRENGCSWVQWRMSLVLLFWLTFLAMSLLCLCTCSSLQWIVPVLTVLYLTLNGCGVWLDQVVLRLYQKTHQTKLSSN